MILQDRNNLLFGIALALHIGVSSSQKYKETPNTAWLELRGYGQQVTKNWNPDDRDLN